MISKRSSTFGRFALILVQALCFGGTSDAAETDTSAGHGFDPRARLERSLAHYAEALEEPDREARIAKFGLAEAGFASVLERGASNAALWTNLGNAALQAEQRGRAVLAYHRALRLDPNAEAARQNLAYVRTLLPKWVPRPGTDEEIRALAFYRRVTPANRSMAAGICFALAAASFAVSIRRREGAWRALALAGAVVWALLLASVVFDVVAEEARRGVVTADEAPARSADSRLAPLAYPEPLPAGVEVEILEERDDWIRVRLYNGRDVWLRSSNVTPVRE